MWDRQNGEVYQFITEGIMKQSHLFVVALLVIGLVGCETKKESNMEIKQQPIYKGNAAGGDGGKADDSGKADDGKGDDKDKVSAKTPFMPEVGKIAQDIEGTDMEGVSFKLSDYKGKVVVLDFWGDW